MRLLIATNNAGKVREIKKIFEGVYDEIVSLKDIGLKVEVEESGTTFLENARKKAFEISMLVDCDVLADDSGLAVDGLGGAPGVYSARYAGEPCDDEKNNEKLIKNVENMDETGRKAQYICAMALYRNGKEIANTEGVCGGVIVTERKGENGFGYDPFFYVPEFGMTMAEMDADTKNGISHRGKALEQLKNILCK